MVVFGEMSLDIMVVTVLTSLSPSPLLQALFGELSLDIRVL